MLPRNLILKFVSPTTGVAVFRMTAYVSPIKMKPYILMLSPDQQAKGNALFEKLLNNTQKN